MNELKALVKRNTKLFFKDKGTFFTALITPLILLFLYIAFLGGLYHDMFEEQLKGMGQGVTVSQGLVDALVGGQLFSSLLAVCCVTVAFCSNMQMVNDKVTGSRFDLNMTPVKKSIMAWGYYISTAVTTLIVTFLAIAACLIYVALTGWYLSLTDILLVMADVFLLTMFGTALSSIVNVFLSSQGQISAVGTIVSAAYGFICGAYMPISQFNNTLQTIISFLPGTYGTALLRKHTMSGAFAELEAIGFNSAAVNGMRDMVDSNIYFFDRKVPEVTMFLVLGGSVVLLIAIYVVINILKNRKPN